MKVENHIGSNSLNKILKNPTYKIEYQEKNENFEERVSSQKWKNVENF